MASSNNDLQALTTSYQSLSTQLQTLIEARQRLDSQLSENTQVAKEFSGLTPNNQVYKLMGPVLMKVDQEEAKSNVDKRIEYIQGEIKRVEEQLKDIGSQTESKRMQIIKLQQQAQQQQAASAGA